jgi:ubiquinone biosynthesis protein UbiJ
MHDTEEKLKALRKLGVKFIEFGTDGLPYKVEFFPSADELEKKTKAEEEADTKVNPSTGLTKAQSRDLLGMDE